MYVNLENKVVVITGSSRGIGSLLAKRFAMEKANVVLNYNNSKEDALKVYSEINSFNKNCILVQADVTKSDEVKKLYKTAINAFGHIDILINNAGICSDNLIVFMKEYQWDQVIETNLKSMFLCSKIFSKDMIKQKKGKIINIASFKGQVGSEGQSNYSASKAGVIGLSKALAKELGKFNISVNAICPGYITTDLNRNNIKKKEIAQTMSALNINANLDELLNFLIYISSDNFNYVSGRVFNIDSRIM